MRPHHFLLIIIGIVVSLSFSLSAVSHARTKSPNDSIPEHIFPMPWGGSSSVIQMKFDFCAINAA